MTSSVFAWKIERIDDFVREFSAERQVQRAGWQRLISDRRGAPRILRVSIASSGEHYARFEQAGMRDERLQHGESAVSAARHLGNVGLADASRLVIMGGSAGGFTVLQTLVTHPGLFKAGVNLFGVSNQFGLAMETHKFEERYTDSLIGPLPEASALYRERSPEFFAHKIVDPLAIFQGEIDDVVPRNQSDAIAKSLKERGIPHEYHIYAGEGHGWRKSETIEAYYTALEKFLKRYVLFA